MTKLEEKIYQSIGEASMCWSETPTGVYDSEQAKKIGDEICEIIRMQMAGISTAAIGYWKESETIAEEYDSVALRDVAKLYQKYDKLYQERNVKAEK